MQLTELQLSQVDAQIKRLIQTDSYYGRIYKEAGITGVSIIFFSDNSLKDSL